MSGRRTLTGVLVYDTQQQRLPRGVRTLHARERRLLVDADEYEVMLQVVRDVAAESCCITGLVLTDGRPVTHAEVALEGETTVRTGGTGVFKAMRSPIGPCRLRLETRDLHLTLSSLDLVSTSLGSL